MRKSTKTLNKIHNGWISLDRFTRIFLFPVSVIFAIAALALAVQTYSDLQKSSISSAFATVQSVEEAYRLETEYPEEVVLSVSERRLDRFWVISESGEILTTSEDNAELSVDLWALAAESIDGKFHEEYTINGEIFVAVGSNSADGSYWTIILLSPPFNFATIVWLIFSILALSLMSISAVIAVRFFEVREANHSTAAIPAIDIAVNALNIGGDGSTESVEPSFRPDLSRLHEAVLEATEDFVLVLDQNRKMIYSSQLPSDILSGDANGECGLTEFAESHFDETARQRFTNWVEEGPSDRSLTMDVKGSDGRSYASKWVARKLEMKSGLSFDVFVGRRLMVEVFPGPSA